MAKGRQKAQQALRELAKCPTGIQGLDEITGGGLPRGRTTIVCGGPGCGKSLLGIEFLIRGIQQFDEPGALISFEESPDEITKNVASLGYDIEKLTRDGKLALDYLHVDRSEIEESGEYDLEGLFIRLGLAIDSVGAKRVVLDTLEALFASFNNEAILRAELRRLFRWLKDRGVTAVITGERGDSALTRQGLEEYVSDCVILLDHRVIDQVSTRRLRVVKYRGTSHGTNEYPFLIDQDGITVMPVTSMGLGHEVSNERISSGVPRLDEMLGGKGFYRGSSILLSGTAGTGKSSLAACFAAQVCRSGERAIYFAFEESESQILRNMRSIGLELEPFVRRDMLRFRTARPTSFGIETHLARMLKEIADFGADAVIIDPISNLIDSANQDQAMAMLTRVVDHLKARQITAFLTALTTGGTALEATEMGISSIMDTWLLLRDIELGGERNRGLYVLKSRGMPHSNQIREFVITAKGIDLLDVYTGPEGVLTGSARIAQEARESAARRERQLEIERRQRELERRRHTLEAEITALRNAFLAEEEELERMLEEARDREEVLAAERERMKLRRAGALNSATNGAAARTRRKGVVG